jgi:hypothetical protein
MVASPFWPDHWYHTGRELFSVFEGVSAPLLRGGEWLPIDSRLLAQMAGPLLAAWFVLIVRQLGRSERLSVGAAAGLVVTFGLFGGSLLSGAKILYLFLLASVLFLPLVAREQGPWPRASGPAAALAALLVAGWTVDFRYHSRDRFPPARDYRAVAEVLKAQTGEGEVVVASWDDFGGLFLFDKKNHYVAGLNTEFLARTDRERFNAYVALFAGQVEEPARVLRNRLDARFIVVRRQPRGPAESVLLRRLMGMGFDEVASNAPSFRVFRVRT